MATYLRLERPLPAYQTPSPSFEKLVRVVSQNVRNKQQLNQVRSSKEGGDQKRTEEPC
jgi:hypothetical protein